MEAGEGGPVEGARPEERGFGSRERGFLDTDSNCVSANHDHGHSFFLVFANSTCGVIRSSVKIKIGDRES